MECNYEEITPGSQLWKCQNAGCNRPVIKSTHKPRYSRCGEVGKVSPQQKRIDAGVHPFSLQHRPEPCIYLGDVIETQECKPCKANGNLKVVDVRACAIFGKCTKNKNAETTRDAEGKIQPPHAACSVCNEYETKDGVKAVDAIPEKYKPKPTVQQITSSEVPKQLRKDIVTFKTIPVETESQPWRGNIKRKPWEYSTTAIIPVLNPDPTFVYAIQLLRLQTKPPFIILIDTGSGAAYNDLIYSLRAPDLEVHGLRLNAVHHSSEPVSMALDMGCALARTRFTFFTHTDCFLRKRTALEELESLADTHIVAGHQITERPYPEWETEFGHTLLMCDQTALDAYNVRWKMKYLYGDGVDYNVNSQTPNVPDTESTFNAMLRQIGIKGIFTGTEINFERTVDDWIDHVRSHASSRTYQKDYFKMSSEWLKEAAREATQRIRDWRLEVKG